MFKRYLKDNWWIKQALRDVKKTIWRYIVYGDPRDMDCAFCKTALHAMDNDININLLCLSCPWVVFKGRACNGLPRRDIQNGPKWAFQLKVIKINRRFDRVHPLFRLPRLAIWWCRLKWWQLKNRYRRYNG